MRSGSGREFLVFIFPSSVFLGSGFRERMGGEVGK